MCGAGGVVQTHDATVILLQVGLWGFTIWGFRFPSGRLLNSRPLLWRGGRAGNVFGKLTMWELGEEAGRLSAFDHAKQLSIPIKSHGLSRIFFTAQFLLPNLSQDSVSPKLFLIR